MAGKAKPIAVQAIIFIFINAVFSVAVNPIPADKTQLENWFRDTVKPHSGRNARVDAALAGAEVRPKVIRVSKNGGGDFRTVTDAVRSVPAGNRKRVVVWIGGGNYTEKVWIDRRKPFITLYGDPKNMPTLVYDGTAAKYGTVDSGTLVVESDYFSAVNVIFANSAPRPTGKKYGEQASAMRIGGDKASFYNCKFHGFQDTICDDKGRHFFKDCYIEGTVDFIYGNGKSLYLNTELHVIPGDRMAFITAHARDSETSDTGYVFVHCKVTGSGGIAFLGRAWKPYARVVYVYSELSDVVAAEGWSNNFHPEYDKDLFFGEYNCRGPGSKLNKRVGFTKKLTNLDAKHFLDLSHIEGSNWLLPPLKL